MNTNTDMLTVKEAAARLGVSPHTVYRLLDAGKLAHYRLPSGRGENGKILISDEDVQTMLAGHYHPAADAKYEGGEKQTTKDASSARYRHLGL